MILAADHGVSAANSDNSAALQACLDLAKSNKQKLMLPPGTLRYTDTLHVEAGVMVEGEGPMATDLLFAPLTAKVALQLGANASPLNYHIGLRDFRLLLDTHGCTGIKIYAAARHHLLNVPVECTDVNMGCIGIDIDGANISGFFNSIRDCALHHMHIGFKFSWTGTVSGMQPTQQRIDNCPVVGDLASGDTTGIGYDFGDWCGEDTLVTGGDCENIGTGIKAVPAVGAKTRNVRFLGARFEGNGLDVNLGERTSEWVIDHSIFRAGVTDLGVNNRVRGTGYGGLKSFSVQAVGLVGNPTSTWAYLRDGPLVTVRCERIVSTSNSSGLSVQSLPAAIRPASSREVALIALGNSAAAKLCSGIVLPSGELLVYSSLDHGGFTSGTTALIESGIFQYIL